MRTILLIFTLLATTIAYGQVSPKIEISNEKVKENGVVKYVHHVKKGETLYSISKAYSISIDELIRNNESVKSGLKEGGLLFIPLKGAAKEEAQKSFNNQKDSEKSFKEQNDNQSISNNQEAEVKNAANYRDANNVTAANVAAKNNVSKTKKYKKHTARWFETIYDIAAKYKVPVEALMSFNNLQTRELTKRQVLYIPDIEYINSFNEQKDANFNKQQDKEQEQEQVNEEINNHKIYNPTDRRNGFVELSAIKEGVYKDVDVSIILPLHLKDTSKLSSNFMDFYSGALIAANELKSNGYRLNINLIDQQMYSSADAALSAKRAKENSNFIIGPVKSSSLKNALEYTQNEVPVISPMDQYAESLYAENPEFIQVPSGNNVQIKNIVEQLKKDYYQYDRPNIIVIYDKNGSDTASVRIVKELLDQDNINFKTLSYGILEGRQILHSMNSMIKGNNTTLVIVPSNGEAFVSDVVRNLNLCAKYDNMDNISQPSSNSNSSQIILYGMPKWKNFETIEPSYFHNMQLHLSLPYFVDYSREAVKDFLLKYRALFSAEPSPYSFQGYDILMYFTKIYGRYGKDFIYAKNLDLGRMLQSNFDFVKDNPTDGFTNRATVNIIYKKDYSISVIE